MTDKEIIAAFRTSNQRVLRLAYYDMKDKFSSFIHKCCPSLDNTFVEDIYHSSLIELQQNVLCGKLTEDNLTSTLQTYLNAIGYNVVMNHIRKQHIVFVEQPEILNSTIVNPIQLIIENENFKIIRKVIMEMGKPCAPILIAFYWDNLKMEKIAEKLGYRNADSVKNQKARCISKLKEYLKPLISDIYD